MMFDYSLAHWTTFFTATVLLIIAPGPDLAYILGQTFSHGRKGGFSAMAGICTGGFSHVFMAVVGLSALLATSVVAFSVIKWLGGAYLIWIGIRTIQLSGASRQKDDVDLANEFRAWQIYRQGTLISALNPKVALFYLAFLPQFVEDGAGSPAMQLLLHGCLIILGMLMIQPWFVLSGSAFRNGLQQNYQLAMWVERCLGGLFILLGVQLALT